MNNNTYPVPENDFGIFAAHSREPLDQEFLKKIIDGPITLAQDKLNEALNRDDREVL